MKLIILLSALAAFNFAAAADDKKSDKKTDKKPAAGAKPSGDGKKSDAKPASDANAKTSDLTAGPLTFKAAAPWVAKKAPRAMSKGGYTIPGKGDAAGVEADIFYFGPTGGGPDEDNIKRWQSQFVEDADGNLPEGKHEEMELGGKKATVVTFKGTFLSGSVMDDKAKRKPLPGHTMTGIILPTDEGPLYIKFNGPDAAMTGAADQIKALLKSAFPDAK